MERKLWFQYGSLKGYRGCPASLGTFFPSTWKRDRHMTLLEVNISTTQGIISQNFLSLTCVQHDAKWQQQGPSLIECNNVNSIPTKRIAWNIKFAVSAGKELFISLCAVGCNPTSTPLRRLRMPSRLPSFISFTKIFLYVRN